MRASAVGHSGPLRNVTFYNGIGSNLISAAKLCSDSNVSIVITKAGMSLIHDDEASKLLQRSAANKLCSTTSNGLYKVRLRRLDASMRCFTGSRQDTSIDRSWPTLPLKRSRSLKKRRGASQPSSLRSAYMLLAMLVGETSSALLRRSAFSEPICRKSSAPAAGTGHTTATPLSAMSSSKLPLQTRLYWPPTGPPAKSCSSTSAWGTLH